MFRVITCIQCGTPQTLGRITPGKKVRCRACGQMLPPEALDDLLRMQGLMRMGDDDDAGGGGSSAAEAEGGDDDDDEDEDEEDGKGKKKKKKSKSSSGSSGGGFFQNMFRGFMIRVITAVVFFGLLAGCCCCAIGWGMIFGFGPPFVGEWESEITKIVKVKDKDDKGKEIEKEEMMEVPVKLVISKTDDKSGTGTYTIQDEKPVSYNFKWRDWDKEKKTVVFEMDNKDDKFWDDLKSPTTFTYDTIFGLSLAADGKTMNFNRPVKDAPPRNVGKKKKR